MDDDWDMNEEDFCDNDPELFKSLSIGNGASLAVQEGSTIHFLVTDRKESNYLRYCNSIISVDDPVAIINKYTEHTNKVYRTINLALASDSPSLSQNADYIQDLRSSVLQKPLLESSLLYRGVSLSPQEITQMESLQHFFIPSFTSTSLDFEKAYGQKTMLSISTGYCSKFACSITEDLSPYYNEEREVLLACYSAFRLQRIEVVNQKKIISLYLDEYSSALDKL